MTKYRHSQRQVQVQTVQLRHIKEQNTVAVSLEDPMKNFSFKTRFKIRKVTERISAGDHTIPVQHRLSYPLR